MFESLDADPTKPGGRAFSNRVRALPFAHFAPFGATLAVRVTCHRSKLYETPHEPEPNTLNTLKACRAEKPFTQLPSAASRCKVRPAYVPHRQPHREQNHLRHFYVAGERGETQILA